jgi:hypothetical protein
VQSISPLNGAKIALVRVSTKPHAYGAGGDKSEDEEQNEGEPLCCNGFGLRKRQDFCNMA